MRVHYIQHVPFEGLGHIEKWLNKNHHSITATHVWEQPVFPSIDEFDVLIVMGGPMGVYDDHLYKWLPAEKNFITEAINKDKKIIGICLGAQLIACVMGAAVQPNEFKEIGWFPVQFHKELATWLGAEIPGELTVFHWHGDRFDNPMGGAILASSEACDHQLFVVGNNIIGLQFHLEANPESVLSMLKFGADELAESRYVQTAQVISSFNAYDEPNKLMSRILERLCGS